jgi:hypothetical protein
MAPGLGTAIGTALGATGATAAVVGGAVIGGATAELTGGDFVQGAIGGGIGAGLGQLAQGAGGTVAGNAADMTVQTAEQLGQGFENTMSAAGYQPVGSVIADALAPAPAPDYNVQPEVIQGPTMPEVPMPEAMPVPDYNVQPEVIQGPGPAPTPAPTMGPGYYDEITGQYIQDPNGGLQAPLTPESGTFPITESNYANGQWTMPGNVPVDAPLATTAQTGAQIMANAGAQPTTSTTSNNAIKQLLGAGATVAGTTAGLMGSGAPTGAGEDQIFGKASQSKYSFDQQQPQYTPQSLMTISQLLGRR